MKGGANIQGILPVAKPVLNPLEYTIENVESVKDDDIGEQTNIYLKNALLMGSWVVQGFIEGLYLVITTIITLLLYLTPFTPLFLVIFVLFFLCQTLWDDITAPIIRGMIDAYNGVINQWNKVTDSVRDIGFDIPFPGKNFHVHLFGIDLPHGDTVDTDIKPFLPFVLDIFYYTVLEPIKLMTAGYIFRDEY